MTNPLQAYIDAPLANALKLNLPAGRLPAKRAKKLETDDIDCPKVSQKELRERKARADAAKLEKLFDYYATTTLTAETVAEHMGLYRQEQNGTDDKGKPVFARVLDVKFAADQLAWRRKAAR